MDNTWKPSDEYRGEDGVFVMDEIGYDDLKSLIQSGWLGFCGCGIQSASLEYILGGLMAIREVSEATSPSTRSDAFLRREKYFGNAGAELLFYYWLDKEGLTKHCGSVTSSWLADRGMELLALLLEWNEGREDNHGQQV